MRRAAHVTLAAFASLMLLAGCGPSGHADLDAWMKEQGKNARGKLDPLPEIKPYEPFAYNDFDLPDPFKPRKIEPAKGESTSKLAPDLNRRREALEAYPLESLSMVGTLGVCLPVSIRQRCSKLMPASSASLRCDRPAATRSRIILRARLARAYSTAG